MPCVIYKELANGWDAILFCKLKSIRVLVERWSERELRRGGRYFIQYILISRRAFEFIRKQEKC